VAQHGRALPPLARLLGQEAAPRPRGDTQRLEEGRTDAVALDALGRLAAAQARVPPLQADELAEHAARLRLPVEEVCGRDVREVDAVEVPERLVDAHQPLLVRERERAHHDRVEHVEDDGVGREPQRQRRHQQQAGGRALDEPSKGVAGVPDQV
jgi:hypothetical protein